MPLNVKSFYSNKTVKCCFLQDAIEEVEQEDVDAADFVLTGPSNADNVTEEEEEEDDEIFNHSGLPEEVSGEIEVVTRSIEQDSNDDEGKYDEESSDGDEPSRKQKKQNKKTEDRKEEKPKWKKSHLKNPVVMEDVTSEKVPRKLLNMHLSYLIRQSGEYLNVSLMTLELLVEHANRYTNRDKNNLQFTVTNDEMMKFIRIIFLSGYNKRTCETDYWSKSPDLECLIVASAMSRTRFQHIKSYLHAADNQNLSETKMAKIEPLYQILNEKFQRYGIFHENLSIDESMCQWSLTLVVIRVNSSFEESQLGLATRYGC